MNKEVIKRVMHGTKFKTNIIAKYFVLPLSDKNAVLGSILSEVLLNSSKNYKTIEDINIKQEELYGSVLYFDMNKYADKLIFEAKMVFPSNVYIHDDVDLAFEAENFFNEILYNPDVEDGMFNQKIFDNEKQNLILEFKSLEKNVSGYAHRRLVECVYGDDKLGVYKYGSKKVAKSVTNSDLSDFYNNVLLKADTYTYYNGWYGDDSVDNKMPSIKNHSTNIDRTIFQKFSEKNNNNQSIFTRAYYFDIDFNTKEQYAAALLCIIIGGGSSSILFNEIREKLNLCYYIYTIFDKFRNMMFLNLGMESKNYALVSKEVDRIIENIEDYVNDEKNINNAKTQFINSLKSLEDAQLQSIDYVFLKDLFGISDNIEDRIEKTMNITSEDIINVSKKMSKNTEFYLEGETIWKKAHIITKP